MRQTTEDYRRRMRACTESAETSHSEEIKELWLTVAASYRFLMEREERIEGQTRPTQRPF
ncbi:MAG TPA: hypothetical protein VH678_15925 [Xanthobacteraceae bacterium]|jgi:hypothetical protein